MITIGRIIRPWGRRGEVIVESETDFAEERFVPNAAMHVRRTPEGAVETLTVRSGREHDRRWVIGFDGVDSIDAAETLRGLELTIPDDAIRPLGEGAFYVHDLAGCRVETGDGKTVGTIDRVEFGSGVPALVIKAGTREVMIPFIDAFCRRVDVKEKLVVVEPPQGLLEL